MTTNRRTGRASDKPTEEQSPEQPTEGINDKIMSLSVDMKRNIKKVIVHNAIAMAMQDFAAGDYGDIEEELFAQFSGGMLSPLEAKCQALLEGQTLKPALPPSFGEQTTSYSSTC